MPVFVDECPYMWMSIVWLWGAVKGFAASGTWRTRSCERCGKHPGRCDAELRGSLAVRTVRCGSGQTAPKVHARWRRRHDRGSQRCVAPVAIAAWSLSLPGVVVELSGIGFVTMVGPDHVQHRGGQA